MEEVAKAHHVECTAQKLRKTTEAKAIKKAKKWRIAEKKKKKQIEYLHQLQDKVLVENTTFLEGMEDSQVMGTKCKKVILGDKEG